ncbi:SDR family NAD(P)-dependent oxidoreductase [Terricaulis sp.]|uniref:SDR family NAD(P)-dependent oxidoreductase n=1 Tax=Terricaulis sp. TaxID=2768686 RepID=UPI00378323FA
MSGRHAFITGGGSGIGLAAARALASAGVKLTLVGRSIDKVRAAAEEFDDAQAVACDVTDELSVKSAFNEARDRYGSVDILINNAGQAPSAPFRKTDLAFWNNVLAVNLTGAFLCTHAALPDMTEAKWGRIVNVGSVCSLKGYAYVTAYCASKHGLLGLTRALAHETAKSGVTVNCVCPGYVDTPIITESVDRITAKTALNEAEAHASLIQFNPMGRIITAEEVAAAIAYLCSDLAAATNGAALPITGGEI